VRVVIDEDMALLREGLSRLLGDAGFDVVGTAGDLPGLLKLVADTSPEVALIDIKMPPTHTDEGLQAAATISDRYPRRRCSCHRVTSSLAMPTRCLRTVRQVPATSLRNGCTTLQFWGMPCGACAPASA
jgi:DNA-binding NarL/FixJ family response regulator